MKELFETFSTYPTMLQVFWAMALVSSLVFIIQTVMLFIGFDSDTDADFGADSAGEAFDASGFHLVSVKTIICFILGFGWTGVLFWNRFEDHLWLGLLAAVVGLAFMALIAWLLSLVMKLDRNNTFEIRQTIGLVADVYLRIPADKSDTGKVTVSVNGSMHELNAMSESDKAIATGSRVRVTGVIDGETVLVEEL